MSTTKLLDVGLMIQHEGRKYECVKNFSSQLSFKGLEDGESLSLETADLLRGIATEKIKILDGKVTANYVEVIDSPKDESLVIGSLSEKNQKILDLRLEFVIGVIKRRISRGQLSFLREAAEEIAAELNSRLKPDETPVKPPSPATLNRWLTRFEKGAMDIVALVSGHVLRKSNKRIDPKNEELISESLDTKLFDQGVGKISEIVSAYERSVEAYNHEQESKGTELLPIVGRSTIARRFYDIPSFDRDVAIHGVQAAKVNHRVSKGHLPSSFALEFVEVDHGQLDLYVIDDLLFIPLGIPWITILRDRHTGVVLGFYISFRRTSLQSIFGAIRHSIMPHERIINIWPDIRSPWPSGFGLTYVSDRGADFLSPRYRLALREMGSDVIYCAARRPWHKGAIERFIGHTNRHLIESMPGKTFPFRRAPVGYDARKQAVVRFSTLVYLVHKWIAEVYHHQPHSRKLASPLERWNNSIADMPPPAPPGTEKLIVLTGEQYERSIGQDGIVHNWLNYTSPHLQDICNDLGRVKIAFISNPENLGFAIGIDPRTKESFRLDCMLPEYANGLSATQHAYIRRNTKIKLSKENVSRELLRTQQEIQESLAEDILSKQSADKARLYQAAIHAGINSNAVLDGKPRSVADILKAAKEIQRHEPAAVLTADASIQFAGSSDVPHFDWI